jgi:predicted nucleic acid-binding protein
VAVVIDANLLVVLALDRRRAAAVEERLRAWREAGETLHAPSLVRYEVASALTRAVGAGQLAESDVGQAWRVATDIPITLHELDAGWEAVEVARRLGRQSAYDAAYIVLAQALSAELWTLDGPLARNAGALDLPVRLIETF